MTDAEILEFVKEETGWKVEMIKTETNFVRLRFPDEESQSFFFFRGEYDSKGNFVRFFGEEEQKDYLRKRCRRINSFFERRK